MSAFRGTTDCFGPGALLRVVLASLALAGALAARPAGALATLRKLPLPALAKKVEYKEDLEQGWQMTGTVSGPLGVVEKDFSRCLQRGGWALARDYPLRDTPRNKLCLYEWTRDDCLLLLMIEQRTVGLSNFRLGITQRRAKDQP